MPDDSGAAKYGTLRLRILSGIPRREELSMKICMAQINTLVGDIAANAQRVIEWSRSGGHWCTVDRVSGADAYRLSP